jgi:DNA-binding CsgD family transcriptional regulator
VRPDFLDTLYALTEGNPFFIEETLKALLVAGDLFSVAGDNDAGIEGGTGQGDSRKAIEDLHVPRSVQDAVQRRLAHLSAEAQELLRVAAVAGQRFDFALLRELSGRDEGTLLRLLKELIAAQFVVEDVLEEGALGAEGAAEEDQDQDHFRFRHALTRLAIYAELLARERRTLHRALAQTLERVYAERLDAHLAQLAYHFYAARLWPQALEYARRAGERSLALYAPQAALAHFTRALGAAKRLGRPAEAALSRGRGKAYETLGDFARAERDYAQALAAARQVADGTGEWQALMDLGFLWTSRDYQRAGDYFRLALERAEALGDARRRAASLNRVANWCANIGQVTEALQLHHQALAIFEAAGDQLGAAQTLDLLGTTSGMHGDGIAAVGYCDRAIVRLRALGEVPGLISSLTLRAAFGHGPQLQQSFSALRPVAACEEDVAEALRLARQIGSLPARAYAACIACTIAVTCGRFGEGLARGREALRLAEEAGHPQWRAGAYNALAFGYVMALAPGRAATQAAQGLAVARGIGSAWWVGNCTAMLAWAQLLAGETEQAARTLWAVLPPEQELRTLYDRRLRWTWGVVALVRGEASGALAIADELLATAPGEGKGQPIPWLLLLRGEALLVLERGEEAAAALEAAVRGAVERHEAAAEWQMRAALGRVYHAVGRELDAQREGAAARMEVERLATTLDDAALRSGLLRTSLLAATEALLGAAAPAASGDPAASATAAQLPGLSEREVEVLRLVARGMSNRAIAAALTLSEHTINSHLVHIFNKLGVNSRTAATALAVRLGMAG